MPTNHEKYETQQKGVRHMRQLQVSQYQLMTIQEAALYTGLSVGTIYTMVSQRRIPYVKVGRLLRFDVGLLNHWLKEQTVMPMPNRMP